MFPVDDVCSMEHHVSAKNELSRCHLSLRINSVANSEGDLHKNISQGLESCIFWHLKCIENEGGY